MNIENGQYIAGEFLGVRVEDKTNRNTGETWQEYFFGISIPVRKGYEGQTVTIDVKLPKAAIESGEIVLPDPGRGLRGHRIRGAGRSSLRPWACDSGAAPQGCPTAEHYVLAGQPYHPGWTTPP